jgi:hypothetical protein
MRLALSWLQMETSASRDTPGCCAFKASMSGKTLHGNDNRCDRIASYAASFMAASRRQRRGDSTLEGATASARRASNSGAEEGV